MVRLEEMQRIRANLKEKLDPRRYEHTLGVSFTAAALAMAHGEDVRKAQLAGLLHDCAKRYPEIVLIEKCEKHGVSLTKEELAAPQVIHAKYGRYLAVHKYGITDEDVLNAIAYHTTGRAGMSRLEKIVFIADYIEPLRDKADDLGSIRPLAFQNLDACMTAILEGTARYLEGKHAQIAPDTFAALRWFRAEMEKENYAKQNK